MAETPKSVFHHLARHRARPLTTKENPKSVFRRMAQRQRNLLVRQREHELLALCARAEIEADADRSLAIYQLRRYDLGRMAPGIREIVWRVLDRIAAAHHGQEAHDAGPQRPVPPGE